VSTPTDQPSPFAHSDQAQPSQAVAQEETHIAAGDGSGNNAYHSPDDPPWGLAAAIGVLLGSLALLVIIPLCAIIPYIIWRKVNLQQIGEMLQTDKTAILITIISNLPAHLLTLALAWIVVTSFGKHPFWSTMGWKWNPRLGPAFDFFFSAGAAVGLFILGIVITLFFGEQETALTRLLNSSMAARYAIVVLAVLTAPVVEEVVYRGVFYPALQRRVGRLWGIVGVMTVFALIHVPQYLPSFGAIATIGILSLSLTLVRAYTGRLLPCVIIHTLFNSLSSVFILLEPYLKRLLPNGEQPTSSLMLDAASCVARIFRSNLL
jgi:membrane protease YdiL (CAAX protease family)